MYNILHSLQRRIRPSRSGKGRRTRMPLERLLLTVCVLCLCSCNDFLDTMPDNRTELDSEQKVQSFLAAGYLFNDPIFISEFSSDNVDDYGPNNPNYRRFVQQVFDWQDVTEADNESPEMLWEDAYSRIAGANAALQAIEELEQAGKQTATLAEAKAEALLCRAYNHFVLVNIFSLAYNGQTSETDLGIPYVTELEDEIGKTYERGTVAEVYRNIERDLQEALPLVGDAHFAAFNTVSKYHFNTRSAYAFASRFYLYYEQWEKAIEYADKCLGSSPQAMLRDWQATAAMTQQVTAITQHYIDATLNCNLMLLTAYSYMGLVFGPYRFLSRYSHGAYLANNETGKAENIWGSASFYSPMHTYAATNLDKVIFWKLPYLFEYVDAVAGTGYYRTVYPAFTADEVLLNRAEAYVLTQQYDRAAADLTLWMQNIIDTQLTLTPQTIQEFYADPRRTYSYDDETGMGSTIKKHLHPAFAIDAEGSVQETMLQCVLNFRRIETLQTGLRWYDVKRYGIEIVRRVLDERGLPKAITGVLRKDDPRRAIQIPQRVRTAGMEGNPREAQSGNTPSVAEVEPAPFEDTPVELEEVKE